ncbi:hypothetical protein [Bradyrhizobium centrosematis]|uniref:hypothetical protein n=1 Tax=Bradyrhizobium centrosematis TaxID=1300039 RepID=UPI00388F600B
MSVSSNFKDQSTAAVSQDFQSSRTIVLLSLLGLIALCVAVITSPNRFIYDEVFFIKYVDLLKTHGFSREFMLSLPGAPGPLVGVVHYLAEPLTSLKPANMRLVNFSIFLAVVLIVSRMTPGKNIWVAALIAMSVPMVWVIAGLALSEMPAMLCVAASVLFLIRAMQANDRTGDYPMSTVVLSAAFLGVAIWGRQPYALLASLPIALAARDRKFVRSALVYLAVIAAFALPLLLIWKGLVPPKMQTDFQGLVFRHLVLSLGYAGICMLIVAPQSMRPRAEILMILAIASALSVYFLPSIGQVPLRSLVEAYLPGQVVQVYALFCGAAFVLLGACFAYSVITSIVAARDRVVYLASVGLLVCAVAPFFIAGQYSSRYTAMALPFFVLRATQSGERSGGYLLLLVLGNLIGVLSLFGYYYGKS